MSAGIELEPVVRIGARGRPSGKIHLTAVVPESGDVRTLCGKSFPSAAAQAAEQPADCQLCLRRRNNPSLVSAALFEAGLGSRLLELSVRRAGERAVEQTGRSSARLRVVPEPPSAAPAPAPPRPPEPVQRAGELRVRGLKEIGEDRFRSPAGVLIRLQRRGDAWYVAELTHEGSMMLRRRSDTRFEMTVGDVAIELEADGAVRGAYSLR